MSDRTSGTAPSALVGPRVPPAGHSRTALRAAGAAGLALGGVVLGICVLVLLRGVDVPVVSTADPVAPVSRPVPPPPGPAGTGVPGAVLQGALGTPAPPVAVRPTLTVLNNSRIPRLAEQAAVRYRAAGWPVGVVGSFRGRIVATTVYYAPGGREQAREVAARFGVPRVLPRFAGLPGFGLTVVVTRDLA